MVWNPSHSQRTPQPTTLLVLPPLPVSIIAEQWDEQLPGGSGIWLDDDEDGGKREDDVDGPKEMEGEMDVTKEREEPVKGEKEDSAIVTKLEMAEDEDQVVGGKRKREDVDDDNAKDTAETNDEDSLSNPAGLFPTTTKRKRDDSHRTPHPKPIPPTSSAHPYQRTPNLTQSHLQPEVIQTARIIASEHGIKLALSSDELIKLDLTAYQNALIDPSTVGNGTVALARARRARMNGNGSVDGMFEDGTASPGPMSVGGGGYGTPGPSGGGGTPVPSTPTGARGSARGRSRGMGRWGHLYAKRAQQAAAAAAAAKQAEEAASAAAALASAQSYLAAQSAAQVEQEESTVEMDKEKMEREERERAEEGLALMKAMEEKKEAMAKGLGSASYWNHLLIEARRQRGPQWDVNTQSYQVDRGSALYYSNVHGPPPSPPPASPPKHPHDLQARADMPAMGSQQPMMTMQVGGGQQPQRSGMSAGPASYSGVQADPRLQYPSQQLPQQQQAPVPQWMMGMSGGPQQQQQQRSVSGTSAVSDSQRPGSSGRQTSVTQGTPSMQNQQPTMGMSASNANRDTPTQITPAQVLAQRQQSTSQQQLAQMHRSLQDQQAAQQQQQLLALQAQRHRDMMAARMAGLQQAAAGGSPASGMQQQLQGQSQQQQQRGLASNLSVGLNSGQWPMMQGLTAAQLAGLQQSYQSSSQQQPQQQSQQFMQQGGMFSGMNNMGAYGGGMMGKMNVQGMQMPQMGQYAQQQQQQQQQGGNA